MKIYIWIRHNYITRAEIFVNWLNNLSQRDDHIELNWIYYYDKIYIKCIHYIHRYTSKSIYLHLYTQLGSLDWKGWLGRMREREWVKKSLKVHIRIFLYKMMEFDWFFLRTSGQGDYAVIHRWVIEKIQFHWIKIGRDIFFCPKISLGSYENVRPLPWILAIWLETKNMCCGNSISSTRNSLMFGCFQFKNEPNAAGHNHNIHHKTFIQWDYRSIQWKMHLICEPKNHICRNFCYPEQQTKNHNRKKESIYTKMCLKLK